MCGHSPALTRRTLLGALTTLPLGAALTGCTAAVTASAHAATPARSASAPTVDPIPVRFTRSTAAELDDPGSLTVVVDKHRPLHPKTWIPTDLVTPDVAHTNPPQLRRPAARALERMFAAAHRDGVMLVSLSAYRAFTVQRRIYLRNRSTLGLEATEKLTLRPGYSEHQTGLAIDIGGASRATDLAVAFTDTPAAAWLRAHAWRHGFLLRYERGRKAVTGIQFEPWHYRYVGRSRAADYRAAGAHTLEGYFRLPAAPDYR